MALDVIGRGLDGGLVLEVCDVVVFVAVIVDDVVADVALAAGTAVGIAVCARKAAKRFAKKGRFVVGIVGARRWRDRHPPVFVLFRAQTLR